MPAWYAPFKELTHSGEVTYFHIYNMMLGLRSYGGSCVLPSCEHPIVFEYLSWCPMIFQIKIFLIDSGQSWIVELHKDLKKSSSSLPALNIYLLPLPIKSPIKSSTLSGTGSPLFCQISQEIMQISWCIAMSLEQLSVHNNWILAVRLHWCEYKTFFK